MEEKRTFWVVALVVALVAVSAAVAYFVVKYLRAQSCEELLDEYDDYDYDYDCDCDCGCDCDCDCEAAPAQ